MSLYDRAKVFFSAAAGAGANDIAYNIKPEEKLKVDELITNNKLLTSDGWSFSDSNITVARGKIVFNNAAQYATARWDTDVFVEGKTYKISFKVEDFKGGASNSKLLAQQANNTQINTEIDRDGKYSFYYTPGAPDGTNNQHRFQLKTVTTSLEAKVSDFSIKEVEQKANDFSFVRGSDLTATHEGADGLIKKTTANALQYTNDYSVSNSDGGWTKNNASVSYGFVGHDGESDAWKLQSTTASSFNNINQGSNISSIAAYGDKVSTFSVYVKKGNTNWIRLNLNGTGNVYFDLDGSGAVGTASSGNVLGKIETIGTNGWFRCSITRLSGGTFDAVYVYLAASDGNLLAADHSESKHIFVQKAQLEYGSVPTRYVQRTAAAHSTAGIREDEPRYDYSLNNSLPPVLMLEPERSNLVPTSERFTTGVSKNQVTVVDNHAVSPEGLNNAAKITPNTQNLEHFILQGNLSVTSGNAYTWSAFVKADGYNYAAVRITAAGSCFNAGSVRVDLTDGSVTVEDSTVDATVEAYPNGWYRISATGTCIADGAGASVRVQAHNAATGVAAFAGDGTKAILVYGTQFEKGHYPTSYIPTYGSAATRLGEAHSNLQAFRCKLDEPLTKKYSFVVDVRVDNLERPTTNFDDIFVARSQGALFNDYPFRIEGYYNPNVNPHTYSLRVFAYRVGDLGSGTTTPHTNGIQLGVRNKIAIVFDEDAGIKIFVNGNSTPMAQSTEGGQMHKVQFLEGGGNPRCKTFLYGVQAYDEALSDAECVSLTTIS
tara:strand:+ start:1068 stop:3383 length:2316 start_codon:yes stop_codon:yes gene_type:complete